MTISPTAKANHDLLFGDRVSTLATTDPEFIAYFDNFAFDEILVDAAALDNTLDLRRRLLVQLATILAAGGLAEFRIMAAAALSNGGVPPIELKEIVYHAVPYVGLARVYDYLNVVNEILTEAGIELPLAGRAHVGSDNRLERGRQTQERIVGVAQLEQMYATAPEDCQHFQRYLTGNCFGDTVSRDGIDLPTRELITFSMLAALGGADVQLRGHITGNLNVGNDRRTLLATLTVLVPFIGYPRTLNALAAINDIAPS